MSCMTGDSDDVNVLWLELVANNESRWNPRLSKTWKWNMIIARIQTRWLHLVCLQAESHPFRVSLVR